MNNAAKWEEQMENESGKDAFKQKEFTQFYQDNESFYLWIGESETTVATWKIYYK